MDLPKVELYQDDHVRPDTPIVVIHTFGDRGEKTWAEMEACGCSPCVLAAVTIEKWEETLSPWPAPKVFKGECDFGDGADRYIETLTSHILPDIRNRTGIAEGPCHIAGYSFAGLFALYSLYKTDAFTSAASVSGSLWFPGFTEFAAENPLKRMPRRLYMSLGDKESNTRNEVMRKVGERTEGLFRHYQSLGIDCAFELNQGNHFQDAEKRLVNGIRWILEKS